MTVLCSWAKRLRKLDVSLIKPKPSSQALVLGATFLLALLLVGAKEGEYIAPVGWATELILHAATPVGAKQSPICPPVSPECPFAGSHNQEGYVAAAVFTDLS